MNKLFLLIGVCLALVACGGNAPRKTELTCQKGYGTCYVVHCERRELTQCQSFFQGFCPKGFTDSHYGNDDHRTGSHDRLLECK